MKGRKDVMDGIQEDSVRPRMQILRGPLGSGKREAARLYPCLVIESGEFGCVGGAFRRGRERDGKSFLLRRNYVKRSLKKGVDFVVAGNFERPLEEMTTFVVWAMKSGYEVWIADFAYDHVPEKGVSEGEIAASVRSFVPFTADVYGKDFSRFGTGNPKDTLLSIDEDRMLREYAPKHIHIGMMPKEYYPEPDADGI